LLSLFHIGRRNLEAWKTQLDGILSVAKEDSEPWVCMLAELIKTFPETGKLQMNYVFYAVLGCTHGFSDFLL
jgi:negative elongation factor A